MTIKSKLPLQLEPITPANVNRFIAEMLAEEAVSEDSSRMPDNGYFTQFNLINRAFVAGQGCEFQREDIATRLSLIDLFYTTNFNRFAEFGLEKLTDNIWNLCCDGNGSHSDIELVKKVEAFVEDCTNDHEKARKSEIFTTLFNAKFGIIKPGEDNNGHSAQSLISKYLFFLLENHHSANTIGFPIFDSIAKELQIPLYKKLVGGKASGSDMGGYIKKMRAILDCLKDSLDKYSNVWQMPSTVCQTQFGLLDYFLWRIGKSGRFSFSLLWSKKEKAAHYLAAERLRKNKYSNPLADFNSLPRRFRDWHTTYQSIKK